MSGDCRRHKALISGEYSAAGRVDPWSSNGTPRKAELNRRKHGVEFTEAVTIFADPRELAVFDPDHSVVEERYVSIGQSNIGRLLVVGYTERGSTIRLIFARRATALERMDYEEA